MIALLAEEGDDISNLQPPKEEPVAPKEEQSSPSQPSPQVPEITSTPPPSSPSPQGHSATHKSFSRTMFPSVLRLISEYNITNPDDIKGTGVRGMLTKGDVLAYLGKISGPSGTYKESTSLPAEVAKATKKEEPQVITHLQ